MAAFDIRPLTAETWPALEDLFGPNGACNGCWCMHWRIGSAYRTRSRAHNKAGYASTFARASFKTVARRVPPRPIMRHDLGAMSRGYGGVLRSRRDRDNSARASARSSRE